MKENLQIEWFNVADCLPVPGKEVLITDGNSVSTSMLDSVVIQCDGKGWRPNWRSGEQITKWAFMPMAPEATVVPAPDGPSVW